MNYSSGLGWGKFIRRELCSERLFETCISNMKKKRVEGKFEISNFGPRSFRKERIVIFQTYVTAKVQERNLNFQNFRYYKQSYCVIFSSRETNFTCFIIFPSLQSRNFFTFRS